MLGSKSTGLRRLWAQLTGTVTARERERGSGLAPLMWNLSFNHSLHGFVATATSLLQNAASISS